MEKDNVILIRDAKIVEVPKEEKLPHEYVHESREKAEFFIYNIGAGDLDINMKFYHEEPPLIRKITEPIKTIDELTEDNNIFLEKDSTLTENIGNGEYRKTNHEHYVEVDMEGSVYTYQKKEWHNYHTGEYKISEKWLLNGEKHRLGYYPAVHSESRNADGYVYERIEYAVEGKEIRRDKSMSEEDFIVLKANLDKNYPIEKQLLSLSI